MFDCVGQAMGMSMAEFNEIKQLEVVTFRRKILDVCQAAVEERSRTDQHLALYKYPPNIESRAEPPEHVKRAIRDYGNYMVVNVWIVASTALPQTKSKQKYTVQVPADCAPHDIVYEVVRKKLVPHGESTHRRRR